MKSRSIGALLTLMLTAWPIAAAPGSESGAAAPAWLSDPFVAFAIGDQTRTSIPDSQSETSTVYLYALGWTRAQALANLETIVGLEMNARSAVFTGTRTFTCQGGWWAIVSTLIIENGSADGITCGAADRDDALQSAAREFEKGGGRPDNAQYRCGLVSRAVAAMSAHQQWETMAQHPLGDPWCMGVFDSEDGLPYPD
jgi:hypothetical protein